MMNDDMSKRIEPMEFDKAGARFVTEYGYPGPCSRESTQKYFDNEPIERYGRIWNHHNNTFEKLTVDAGIKKHFTEKELSLDEYLLYAGLTQSLMLNYSLESLRFKDFCSGSLFWMYNDCWGEVGWTIIDYYLCRKISYYGVKRAFEPVKLILRETTDGKIDVMGCNDTGRRLTFTLKYGYVASDGTNMEESSVPVTMDPHSRGKLVSFNKGVHDPEKGVFYGKPDDLACVKPAVLYVPMPLKFVSPKVEACFTDKDGGKLAVIHAQTYCRCVYIDVPLSVHCSDNYFSMLPGERREVMIEGYAGENLQIKLIGEAL